MENIRNYSQSKIIFYGMGSKKTPDTILKAEENDPYKNHGVVSLFVGAVNNIGQHDCKDHDGSDKRHDSVKSVN